MIINWKGVMLVVGSTIILSGIGTIQLWNYFHPNISKPNQIVATILPIAPELKHETTEAVSVAKGTVQVYKSKTKVDLKLPKSVIEDSKSQILTSARIEANEHPQTVTTVIDTETGRATDYVKEEPLPWLALDLHGEAGIYIGIKNGEKAARLEIKQGLVQVKSVHLGAIGSIDQSLTGPINADYFVGMGIWTRW